MAPASGHEAAPAGIARAMRRGHDWLLPYYRDAGLAVAMSSAPEVLAQYLASGTVRNKGRQMPCHPGSDEARIYTACSSIASHVPPAVGMVMASQIQGTEEVTVVTFGLGETSEGDWADALKLRAEQRA